MKNNLQKIKITPPTKKELEVHIREVLKKLFSNIRK